MDQETRGVSPPRDADQGEDVQGRSRETGDYHDLRDKRVLVTSRNNVLSCYSPFPPHARGSCKCYKSSTKPIK